MTVVQQPKYVPFSIVYALITLLYECYMYIHTLREKFTETSMHVHVVYVYMYMYMYVYLYIIHVHA